MKRIIRRNKGFIRTIILVVVALVLLKYFFDISLSDILNSTIIRDIWSIIKSLFQTLWSLVLTIIDFLKTIVSEAKDSLSN